MACNVRVATFFLYLNDVAEGGGTSFPALDVVVQARQGRAAVWYSAKPYTLEIDHRLDHEAQPVVSLFGIVCIRGA
jgi:prolyl 4-hydroxylase